jgi:hypothetical protein
VRFGNGQKLDFFDPATGRDTRGGDPGSDLGEMARKSFKTQVHYDPYSGIANS